MPRTREIFLLYLLFSGVAVLFSLLALWLFLADGAARLICLGVALWSCYLIYFVGRGKATRDLCLFKFSARRALLRQVKKEDRAAFEKHYVAMYQLLKSNKDLPEDRFQP